MTPNAKRVSRSFDAPRHDEGADGAQHRPRDEGDARQRDEDLDDHRGSIAGKLAGACAGGQPENTAATTGNATSVTTVASDSVSAT